MVNSSKCSQAEQVVQLHTMLRHAYGFEATNLTPIHLFETAGRGVYRVTSPNQPTYLLRAYQREADTVAWLTNNAATLCYLEASDYPAPRVHQTKNSELVGSAQGWVGLLLTYVPGEMSTGTVSECQQLGARLAELHCLTIDNADQAQPPLPDSRWQPAQKLTEIQSQLEQAAGDVPRELTGLFAFCIKTLTQVGQRSDLPLTLLHTDPNPFNAICTPQDGIVLVDWDNSGIGPAVLDLGYLLLTTHAVLPEWPLIHPNAALIEAIMDGYCSVRSLNDQERQLLPTAAGCSDAIRASQAIIQAIGRDWHTSRTLTRFGTRYPSLARIGEIAQRHALI